MSEAADKTVVTADNADQTTATASTISQDKYDKAIADNKKAMKDLEDMRTRMEAVENEKLEASGDLKKLLESERAKNKSLSEKQVGTFKAVSEKLVKAQFNRQAEKLGCIDAELAYKAVDLSDLDLDGDFSFDEKSLTTKLEAVAKNKPFLFKKDVSAPRDTIPSSRAPVEKSFSEMTTAELWAALAKTK